MGLDIYLKAEYWFVPSINNENKEIPCEITETVLIPYLFNGISEITVEIARWRNAWFLKEWFQNNCGNCGNDDSEIEILPHDIRKLVDICNKVIENPLKAKEILPNYYPISDCAYDPWYFTVVADTIIQLEPVIEKINQLEKDQVRIAYRCIISW